MGDGFRRHSTREDALVARAVEHIKETAADLETAMPAVSAALRRLAVADAPAPRAPAPPKPPATRASYRTLKDAAQAAANATFHQAGKVQRFGTQGDKALSKDELVKWYLAHWRRHPRSKPTR